VKKNKWPSKYLEGEINVRTWEVYASSSRVIVRLGWDDGEERVGAEFSIPIQMSMDLSQSLFDLAQESLKQNFQKNVEWELPVTVEGSEEIGVPNRVRTVRKQKKLTQKSLVSLTWDRGRGPGISLSTLKRIELGNHVPVYEIQVLLATVMDTPHGELWPIRVKTEELPAKSSGRWYKGK
jgi:DNA-binding XRE family transcriptional regulator